jgi:NAD(P)-dependent dehydrogenase (short-subunit alcohol dehydrogenase family)
VRLQDKVCVVTGAASGIGRATAELFAQEGGRVFVVDRERDGLEDCARAVEGEALGADVSSTGDVERVFARVRDATGRLDVLFNNAGIAANGTVTSTSEEEWDRTIAVNLKSVYLCCRSAIPLMCGGGAIVNNASSWGLIAANDVAAYCASKAGVVNLTRSIAIDYAKDGIRANCLCPGTTDTAMVRGLLEAQPDPAAARRFYERMQPIHRFAAPEEIARAVLYLVSDDASYTTGAVFSIDGGYAAGRIAFEGA